MRVFIFTLVMSLGCHHVVCQAATTTIVQQACDFFSSIIDDPLQSVSQQDIAFTSNTQTIDFIGCFKEDPAPKVLPVAVFKNFAMTLSQYADASLAHTIQIIDCHVKFQVGVFEGLDQAPQITNLKLKNMKLLSSSDQKQYEDNGLSTLRIGIFRGLSRINKLIISRCTVSSIETGAFLPHHGINTNLYALYLSDNSLGTLESSGNFDGLDSIQILDVSGNDLSLVGPTAFQSIKNTIGSLLLGSNKLNQSTFHLTETLSFPNLKTLDISFNNFTQINMAMFDTSKMPALETLRLRNQYILKTLVHDGIAEEDLNFNFDRINLGVNSLTVIPDWILKNAPNLKRLAAFRNQLTRFSMEYVSDTIEELSLYRNPPLDFFTFDNRTFSSLTRLTLYKTYLNHIYGSVSHKNQLASLTYVDLSYNYLTRMDLEFLTLCEKLQFLNLEHNRIEKLDGLYVNHLIEDVRLGHNRLTAIPDDFFRRQGEDLLNSLDLSHNFINIDDLDFGSSDRPHLLHLDLSYNNLTLVYASILAKFPGLTSLDLSHNQLRELSSTSFERNMLLEELDLSNNSLVLLSARVFSPLTHLRKLNLGSNKLDSLGVELAISKLPALFDLNLSGNILNRFPPSQYLPNTYALEYLDLSFNQIQSIEGDAHLSELSSLIYLNLKNNSLTGLSNYFLCQLQSLQVLDITDNNHNEFTMPSLNIFKPISGKELTVLAGANAITSLSSFDTDGSDSCPDDFHHEVQAHLYIEIPQNTEYHSIDKELANELGKNVIIYGTLNPAFKCERSISYENDPTESTTCTCAFMRTGPKCHIHESAIYGGCFGGLAAVFLIIIFARKTYNSRNKEQNATSKEIKAHKTSESMIENLKFDQNNISILQAKEIIQKGGGNSQKITYCHFRGLPAVKKSAEYSAYNRIENEINFWSQNPRHPNLIYFLAIGSTSGSAKSTTTKSCLILECLADRNLAAVIYDGNMEMSMTTVYKYSHDIASAIRYLHENLKMVHRQIEPSNILLTADFRMCKLSGFGCVGYIQQDQYYNNEYSLKKVSIPKSRYSLVEYQKSRNIQETVPLVKADVFGLGLVMMEMNLRKRWTGNQQTIKSETSQPLRDNFVMSPMDEFSDIPSTVPMLKGDPRFVNIVKKCVSSEKSIPFVTEVHDLTYSLMSTHCSEFSTPASFTESST